MNARPILVLALVVAAAACLCFGMFMLDSEADTLRAEAVEFGYAVWVVDSDGSNLRFVWLLPGEYEARDGVTCREKWR